MSAGGFSLVLHGHLPWVLHHGRWPHGEDWLYEAASETWMPLIRVLRTLRDEGIRPCWTLGLTPILLEQLAHPRFRFGFVAYLEERIARAQSDEGEFNARGEGHLAWLATRHRERFEAQRALWDAIDGNIAGALASFDGVELLTSNATHGFHPLILHDASARAQLRAGITTSERHFGHRPAGMWLPECAYRPAGWWVPPAVHGDPRDREGVASLAAEADVRFFFVDTHLITHAEPVAALGATVTPAAPAQDALRCWNSILEPHRVVERGAVTPVTVMGRCPEVSEQVWSGEVGYPGDPHFLEFHKIHGMRGLRYWRVTGNGVDLAEKEAYHPEAAQQAIEAQAEHFVKLIAARLEGHASVGRWGTVCAPFDAELFGHWWHEGPAFLLAVARKMAAEPRVDAVTVSESLARAPADKAAALPRGTWGDGGDERVWFNEDLRFYWELAYHAEDRFLDLWHRAPWRTRDDLRPWLEEAGRQLLMLQASDWPFVIYTEGAVDYGMRRILDHSARFSDLCDAVEDLLAGRPIDPVSTSSLERCRLVDPVFPQLQLQWWG